MKLLSRRALAAVFISSLLCFLFFLTGPRGLTGEPDPVNIPDAVLKSAIRDTLGLRETEIDTAHMLLLNELFVSGARGDKIADLTGLEYAVNLQVLHLSDHQISDLTPLKGLTRLRVINLERNEIEDISPLRDLRSLEVLVLWQNRIRSVDDSISGLRGLTLLVLEENEITDIAPLSSLSGLEGLYLRANRIESMPDLTGLAGLQEIDLGGNEIGDIGPLSGLDALKHLSIDDNRAGDIEPLQALDRLETLRLDGNEISDLSPLSGKPLLSLLNLERNPLDHRPGSPAMQMLNTIQHHGALVMHDGKVKRISGPDRYRTAAQVSRHGWRWSAGTVIVARGDDYADALAGVPLAYRLDAPILLTGGGRLADAARDEILRLGPARVIILGGTGAVSGAVETELAMMVRTVERIEGGDRFETAALIASRLAAECGANPPAAVVAFGLNFPDALAAAAYAAVEGCPILLTLTDSLPAATAGAIADLGISSTIVAGGEAVVGEAVMELLPGAVRVAGEDRYATAAALAEHFAPVSGRFYIATGQDFPDAVTGAVLAAGADGGVLLVRGDGVPAAVSGYLKNHGAAGLTLLGGESAVNLQAEAALYDLLP